MSTVLISNIGNRNITYKGEVIEQFIRRHADSKRTYFTSSNKVNFRSFTQMLWENYAEERENIELNILNVHIEKYGPELEKVYLFTTDQEGDLNYQDTLYEGKIIQNLLDENYQLTPELIPYTKSPINEDAVISHLAPKLRKIVDQHPQAIFLYNDAGGTPQMKSMIKILLDYYLPTRQFKVVYSTQLNETIDKDLQYQKKYQSLAIAREQVKSFDYSAASSTLKTAPLKVTISSELKEYIHFAKKRLSFDHQGARSVVSNPGPLHQLYNDKTVENIPFHNELSKSDCFYMVEILSVCQLYLQQNNFTLAIATYYRFVEHLTQSFAEFRREYDLNTYDNRQYFARKIGPELLQEFPNMKNSHYGVPLLFGYAWLNGSEVFKKLLSFIRPTISHVNGGTSGLNDLRNQSYLAHSNRPILKNEIIKVCPTFFSELFPGILKVTNMPEKNIYRQMNEELMLLFNQE